MSGKEQKEISKLSESEKILKGQKKRILFFLNLLVGKTRYTKERDEVINKFVKSTAKSLWNAPYLISEDAEFGGAYPDPQDVVAKFRLLFAGTDFKAKEYLLTFEVEKKEALSLQGKLFFEVVNRLLSFDKFPVGQDSVVIGRGLLDIFDQCLSQVRQEFQRTGGDLPFFLSDNLQNSKLDFSLISGLSKSLNETVELFRNELKVSLGYWDYQLLLMSLDQCNSQLARNNHKTLYALREEKAWNKFLEYYLPLEQAFWDQALAQNWQSPRLSSNEDVYLAEAVLRLNSAFTLSL